MIRIWTVSAIGILISMGAAAGQPGLKTQFIGGTLPGVQARSTARLDLTQSDLLFFSAGKTALNIPYRRIDTLEYGQTVSRRVALAVVISPILLLSKSRAHYVTIGYQDADGQRQALVFRVDKADIRTIMAGLEARSGQRFTYLADEARKARQ